MYIPPTRGPSPSTFRPPSDTLIHLRPPDDSLLTILPQRDPLAVTYITSILSPESGIATQLDNELPKTFTMTGGTFPAPSSTSVFLARRGSDSTQSLTIPITGTTLLICLIIVLLKQRWAWKKSLRRKETAPPPVPPWVDRSWRSLRSQESLDESDRMQRPQSAVTGNPSDFHLEESSSLGGLETLVNTSDGGHQRASLSLISYEARTLVNARSSFYPSVGKHASISPTLKRNCF
jgi:hypothetical protein